MSGTATIDQAYAEAVGTATILWDGARHGGHPDSATAAHIVNHLTSHVRVGPDALSLGLAPVRACDPPVVSHMVRVTMLTLGLTTAVGVRGPLRLAFGIAALLHDIGKVRTPPEILDGTASLTSETRRVVERHIWDGEQILRATPGLSGLAALVALEHHVREDGSGYPQRIPPRRLNVCTSIVSIADVFDALRTGRPGRASMTVSAALGLMQRERRPQFHQPLLARFADLLGRSPDGMFRSDLVAHVEDS